MTTAWNSPRAPSPPPLRPPPASRYLPDGERPPPSAASLDSPEAFAELFDRYFTEVHRYVARRLGAVAADDIAAETFLIAYRKRASYLEPEGTIRAWLYGIATRQVSRHRRDELRAYRALQRVGPGVAAEDITEQIAERVSAAAAQRQLATALAALSPGDRDVLLLVALADLSHAEVAAALGIPYGTVGSRLSRARRKLRAALEPRAATDMQE